jgi:hypothetical protein
MSPKELTAFRVEADIMEGLRRVKDRDGVPLSVQVDRALRAWLEEKGARMKKPANYAVPLLGSRRRRRARRFESPQTTGNQGLRRPADCPVERQLVRFSGSGFVRICAPGWGRTNSAQDLSLSSCYRPKAAVLHPDLYPAFIETRQPS